MEFLDLEPDFIRPFFDTWTSIGEQRCWVCQGMELLLFIICVVACSRFVMGTAQITHQCLALTEHHMHSIKNAFCQPATQWVSQAWAEPERWRNLDSWAKLIKVTQNTVWCHAYIKAWRVGMIWGVAGHLSAGGMLSVVAFLLLFPQPSFIKLSVFSTHEFSHFSCSCSVPCPAGDEGSEWASVCCTAADHSPLQ